MVGTVSWLIESAFHSTGITEAEKNAVIVSDADKGLQAAVKVVIPNAHHAMCVFHIAENAGKKFGALGFQLPLQNG